MVQALRTSLRYGGLRQGGLQPGLGGDSIFATSSLDLNFAANKNVGPLVDFTRASSGTYVDSQGVIRTATTNEARFDHNPTTGESLGLLVEEQRTNLLSQSEDFLTTWTPTNTTVSTNQITAPDGAITADKVVETATTAEHNIRQDTASQSAGTYTLSIFAKAAERNVIQFVSTGVLGGFRANFDLANGVLGSVDAQLTANIIPFPNGWYRCVVTATSTTAGVLRAQWNIVTSPTSARVESYLGDTSKGLYLWGAQLEAGSFPTSYIPTTTSTVTRSADVASITGSDFGVSRTNLLLQSEDFSTTWDRTQIAAFGSGSVINATVAPDGSSTADLIAVVSGQSLGATGFVGQNITKAASAITYTFSVFAKKELFDSISLFFHDATNFSNRASVIVSLATGSITTAAATAGTFSTASATVTQFSDGWYRISLTATTGTETTLRTRIYAGDSVATTGDGTSGIYLWGAQLETGSTATAYIPTTTAAVTVFESPWYRQDEGTVFTSGITSPNRSSFPSLNTIHDGTSNNRIGQYIFTNGYYSTTRVGNVSQGDNSAAVTPTDGSAYQIASAFAVNNSVTAVNGVIGSVDTSCLIPTALNTLAIGAGWNNANSANSTIRRLTYWPTRLPDNTLQQITK